MNRRSCSVLAGAVAVTSLTMLAVVTTTPPVLAAALCRPSVTLLPDLGYGGNALAFNRDTVVGLVLEKDGSRDAAYWRDGQLHVIGRRFGVSTAGDINAAGDIVGQADFGAVGWVRHPVGGWDLLPDPVPGPVSARRINSSGQVAGSVGDPTLAARWDTTTSDPDLLRPAAGDDASFAKGIDDAGTVAGDTDRFDAGFDDYVPRAAVWSPGGQIRVLPGWYDALAATGWTPGAAIYEINSAGLSAGESLALRHDDPNALRDEATLWHADGTVRGLGHLPGAPYSIAFGLSSTGRAAGVSYADVDGTDHAFVWSESTGMLALPVPGAASYAEGRSLAHQIEGDTVVGESAPNAVTPRQATVWRCPLQQGFVPPSAAGVRHRHQPLAHPPNGDHAHAAELLSAGVRLLP
jgi:uncharacterized membrane protein